jgi:exosortase/archaeosortase family protein
MKKDSKKVLFLFLRYLALIVLVIPGLSLFYYVFLPLTKYPVFYILDIFFKAVLSGDTILIGAKNLDIIGACVAGSAYYFLLILNLSTPDIKPSKRINMILLSFLIFLIVNILRIVILGVMFVNNSSLFELTHEVLWYAGSTILVVGIWFYEVKVFKIKSIPVYSDIKYLYDKSSLKKK